MDYGQEFQREYSDKDEGGEEEDVEDQEVRVNNSSSTTTTTKLPSSSTCSSSPGYSRQLQNQNHHHHQWVRRFDSEQSSSAAATNFNSNSSSKLIDLSLRSSDEESSEGGARGGGEWACVEREHMFDKVVTPSDVGKLNRLVIPKQHAEKYFPLDYSSNDKGLLLNFEDRNGKPWRFRYSYWNSSQSYVMTKGWSRFVKEKKLDAGDVVSFERGVGESGKNRLFIDWRRRPYAPPNHPPTASLLTPLHLPHHPSDHPNQSIRWASRLYAMPPPPQHPVSMPLRHHPHEHLQYQYGYNRHQPYYSVYHHHHQNQSGSSSTGTSLYDYQSFLRSPAGGGGSNSHHQVEEVVQSVPMVIESVPLLGRQYSAANTTIAATSAPQSQESTKRLRLFGVNLECYPSIQEEEEEEEEQDSDVLLSCSARAPAIPDVTMASQSLLHHHHRRRRQRHHLPSTSLEVRLPDNDNQLSSTIPIPAEFLKKGKSTTSLSFALDP